MLFTYREQDMIRVPVVQLQMLDPFGLEVRRLRELLDCIDSSSEESAEVECFLLHDDPGGTYGGRPMEADGSSYLGTTLGQVVEVPVVGINGLLQRESRWDLVHIDIQGHEGDVCRAGITEMTRRVHRVVIGTHSRVQDGIVMDIFHKAGWALENEKPTIAIWRPEVPTVEGMAIVDGVQVWRNPYV
ncbi:MAG: hypothetical protein EOO77_47560 [Oxalobacteraceae bacterium]|nr:MAG: hypothetical protein EOO77_47560 [Oxalobacteraceae bacterium]